VVQHCRVFPACPMRPGLVKVFIGCYTYPGREVGKVCGLRSGNASARIHLECRGIGIGKSWSATGRSWFKALMSFVKCTTFSVRDNLDVSRNFSIKRQQATLLDCTRGGARGTRVDVEAGEVTEEGFDSLKGESMPLRIGRAQRALTSPRGRASMSLILRAHKSVSSLGLLLDFISSVELNQSME